ncbi:helix-turn-helix transcriptional regulator [Undibacterium sp. SXout20W]|uniref:helix-turn-helix transcriptional regulator n=1 Tax=Undibacterium sp. SXout20W TaxID=3413051 RepID=UPI003BF3DBDC
MSMHQLVALIKIAKVSEMTGFEKTFIYNEMAAGRFPRSISVGSKAVRWVSTEIDQWINEQIASRDSGMKS